MINDILVPTASFNFPAASNPRSACAQTGTDYILVTAANNNLYQFSVSSGGANTGTWTFSGPGGVVTPFASGASAVAVDTSSNVLYFANLSASGTVGSLTGSTGANFGNTTHPSNSVFAVYDDLKVVYYPHSNQLSKVNKFTWSNTGGAWSLTIQGIDGMSAATSSTTTAAAKMPNGNLMVGTSKGQLLELNPQNLRLISQTILQLDYPLLYRDDQSTTAQNASVIDIHFNGNYVYAHTSVGVLYVIHWPTLTTIHTQPMRANLNDNILVDMASSVHFYAWSTTGNSGGVVNASDISKIYPTRTDSVFCNDAGTIIRAGGLCGSNAFNFFVVHDSLTNPVTQRGQIFNILASGIPDNVTVTSSLIDTNPVAGRVIRLVDQGVGSSYVYVDTPISNNSEDIQMLNGSTVLEFAVYGEGVNERASLCTYET